MMRKLSISILLSLFSLISFSQDSIYYNQDSTLIYLPTVIDPLVMTDYFIPTRCKNDLSDSLNILLDTFQDKKFTATFDSTIRYTYQFTKKYDIVIDFQEKLSGLHECFVIEDKRDIKEFVKNKEFIFYNKNEWLIVIIKGVPRIGNSTYITNSYIYFKRD